MDELFLRLELESSKLFNVSMHLPDISPGKDTFQNQPQHVDKVYLKEDIVMNGKQLTIRRVYVRMNDNYRNIGWVLYRDIHQCMICSRAFPRLVGKQRKRHCKICGNIVCADCLNGTVRVKEFNCAYVEACANCYWGQDEISLFYISDLNSSSDVISTSDIALPVFVEGDQLEGNDKAMEMCSRESSGEIPGSQISDDDSNRSHCDGEDEDSNVSNGTDEDLIEYDNNDDDDETGAGHESAQGTSNRGVQLMNLLLTLAITHPTPMNMTQAEAMEYVKERDVEYLDTLRNKVEEESTD